MRTVGVLRALHAFLVKPPTVFYRFLRFSVKTVTVIGSLRLVLGKNDGRRIAAVVAHVNRRTVRTVAPPML